MKALIIGCGIGGPVTAIALRRAGIEATVHEAHPGPAESIGLFLTLGVNGMRVLDQLDLLDPVLRARTIPTPEMVFHSSTGRRLGAISNGWLDHRAPSLTLMRGTLQRVLAEAAQARGVDLRFGNRLVEHRWDAGGVTARFEDGSEDRGDLLIGADGIHSRVRRTMSPDAPAPSYTGLLNVGGVARCSGLSSTPGTMHMIWGRRAFFGYTVLEGGESWWFANVGHAGEPARDELAARTTADWKAELCALFAGDPPHVARLVERTDEIGVTPIHDMPSLPRWRRGRTVLLGDAAHAVSPSAGQGASMAIEDAIVLAKCLRDIREPEAALARYEALRRPRTERIVAVGRRRGAYKAPRSRVALRIRDLLMPIVFRHIATEKRMSWIYDYRVRWDEPVIADAA